MGQRPSTSQPGSVWPYGINELNDSVFELYKPEQGVMTEVEIIFFHGLARLDDYKNAFWETWMSREETPRLWPQALLGPTIPKARILSVSYNSSAQNLKDEAPGDMDEYNIAENWVQDIILNYTTSLGQDRPVVLVGHSVGAIIVKVFILMCIRMMKQSTGSVSEKISKFLRNCKGVFYYSPPHAGSTMANPIAKLRNANKPMMNLLTTMNNKTVRINSAFANARKTSLTIKTRAITETLSTTYKGMQGIFVSQHSANEDIHMLYTADADHFDICRPPNDKSPIFTQLVTFIKDTLGELRNPLTVLSSEDREIARQIAEQIM
ncbi:unnamed protein product [Calypogeia fissa]